MWQSLRTGSRGTGWCRLPWRRWVRWILSCQGCRRQWRNRCDLPVSGGNRHYEYHAGVSDGAHQGNRHQESLGARTRDVLIQFLTESAILSAWRRHYRSHTGSGNRIPGRIPSGICGGHKTGGHRGCSVIFSSGRYLLWIISRIQGSQGRPDRRAALRIDGTSRRSKSRMRPEEIKGSAGGNRESRQEESK